MTYEFIPSPNFSERKEDIDTIVIHFTASSTLNGTIAWFRNPKSRVSSHYVIGRDGKVVQMVKDSKKAWHAGKSQLWSRKNVNEFSIGIELVNWGELKRIDGKYYTWPNNWTREYSVEEFGEPIEMNDSFWAPYTELQLQACIKLCQTLRLKYPNITESNILGHMHISKPRKKDPGPHFPFIRIRQESREPEDNYELDISEDELAIKQNDRAEKESWVTRLINRWRLWLNTTRIRSQ